MKAEASFCRSCEAAATGEKGRGKYTCSHTGNVGSTEGRKVDEGPSELISPQLALFAALTHDSQECFLKAVSDSLPLTDREGHVT